MPEAMVSVQEKEDWKGQKVRKIWKILTAHVFQSFLRAKEYDCKRLKSVSID